MKIKGIDFQEELLNAQRNKSLVIFAGAGISIGPPSNYPSFDGLVEDIAKWAGKNLSEGEAPERFLGILDHEGKRVRDKVVKLLSSPESTHNPLHEHLLKVFDGNDQVRIVTTNFDIHFESAAIKVFGQLPEVFRAPALPLGNDFSGIVYLHGSVRGNPKKLVLTDQDFGRAYLTEGWATRFLQAMFSQYTVLFIGYSHKDTVMHYLSRGLPPEGTKPRFALVRADDESVWQYRGIVPMSYRFEAEDDHSQLGMAVAGWVEWANRGALDTEQRIKHLVAGPPPFDDESQDFLKWAVKDSVAVRFFTRHTKKPEWLLWLTEQKILDPLFSQADLPEIAKELSVWVAEHFVVQHADTLFIVLERYSKAFNPWFGYEIVRSLAFGNQVPDMDTISRWVPILLQSKPLGRPHEFTELLKRALKQGASAATVQLFEYLTRPHLNLRKRISLQVKDSREEPQTDTEIGFYGDHYLLSEVWERDIKPKLPELAPRLWPVVTQNLHHAYQLFNSSGKVGFTWDPLNWHRSAIEPHEQDKYPHTEDVLINAARDCLEWTLQNLPQLGHAWIESLSALDPLLLKRLAIHGIGFSSHLTPNDKIIWLLEKNFLFGSGLKHEIFQLLKNAYPSANPDLRKNFLEAANKEIDALPEKEEGDKKRKEYQKFNLLDWLLQAAPDCQEVATRLALIKEVHPDFGRREHQDLDHWSSGASWVGPRSPASVEDLLKKRPTEWLDYFVTFKGDDFKGPDRPGLLQNIGKAVQQNVNWGMELTGLLMDRVGPTSDLWESVIRGWNGTKSTEMEWEYILSILDDEKLATEHSPYISDLLQHGAEKEEEGIPVILFDKANAVALKVWATLKGERDTEPNDWLDRAINHPSGQLTMFWLHALYRTRKERQKEGGLIQPYRKYFETIISGINEAATLGRVVLASQLGFMFAVDQDWAKKTIIPLLDWDHDVQQARQAWDGWLSWGQLSEPLLDELIPLFKKSFRHISSELKAHRHRFVEWVVAISIFWMDDPLKNEWMYDFLNFVESQDRINFASQVGNQLMSMKVETKSGLWQRWLKRYWEDRNQGAPVPLVDGEVKEMVEWSGELEPVFPEVVDVIFNGRVSRFVEYTSLFWRLQNKENHIPTRYPEALAKLLIHLTTGVQIPSYLLSELENLTEKIITVGAPATILRRLCDNLAAIGCVRTEELSRKIDGLLSTEDASKQKLGDVVS